MSFVLENLSLTGLKHCLDFYKILEVGLIGFETILQKL
jgi:hypothetical protein